MTRRRQIDGRFSRSLDLCAQAESPTVLRSDLYAVAALIGAAIVVTTNMLQLPPGARALIGVVVCFWLRVLAIRLDWQLPVGGADRLGYRDTNTPDKP
jgi:uncharacterized membrane protein YeiH